MMTKVTARRVVWSDRSVDAAETRWIKASYSVVQGIVTSWKCCDPQRPEGWLPVDTAPVTWMEDPDPRKKTCSRKTWLQVTKGGRVAVIAIPMFGAKTVMLDVDLPTTNASDPESLRKEWFGILEQRIRQAVGSDDDAKVADLIRAGAALMKVIE